MGEELCDLGVELLFLSEVGRRVAAADKLLDLDREVLLLRLRLARLWDVVFVVHGDSLQRTAICE